MYIVVPCSGLCPVTCLIYNVTGRHGMRRHATQSSFDFDYRYVVDSGVGWAKFIKL
jgi:hypothetical protein